jgi:hypothetical protein
MYLGGKFFSIFGLGGGGYIWGYNYLFIYIAHGNVISIDHMCTRCKIFVVCNMFLGWS